MEKVLFDCDNTMGLAEKDVDDGITLLYLLGRSDVELVGITSVFGNGDVTEVNQVIERMYSELNIDEVPFKRGANEVEDIDTAAAKFLLETARENKGELTLLATGALTNLKAAYQLDSQFFTYLKDVKVMGGITERLTFGDDEIGELNFSCDPEAAKLVLEAPVPVMVATGNLCLDAFFNQADWRWLKEQSAESYQYIANNIEEWYYYGEELIGELGFHLWDLVPALYITHPSLYSTEYYYLRSDVKDLTTGELKLGEVNEEEIKREEPGIINIPKRIKDIEQFKDLIFAAWKNIK